MKYLKHQIACIAFLRSSLSSAKSRAHIFSAVGFEFWNQNQMQFFVGNIGVPMSFGIRVSNLTNAALLEEKPEKSGVISVGVRTLCKDGQFSEPTGMSFKEGQLQEAKDGSNFIQQPRTVTNFNTYDSLLQDCIDRKSLTGGKRVHAHMVRTEFEPGIFLWNRLVDVYARCGSVENARRVFDRMSSRNVFSWNIMIRGYTRQGCMLDARQLFDKMPERDVVSWNAMIAGYGQNEHYQEALELFIQMQHAGVKANRFSSVSILSACSNLSAPVQGKQVHASIVKSGFEFNVFLGNAIVDMYAKCKSMDCARKLFDRMPERDVVSWTAMVAGYAQNGHSEEALKLFSQMRWEDVKLDVVILSSVLSASANLVAWKQGKQTHAYVIGTGLELNIFIATALVDMYAKCGSIEDARKVFDEMHGRNVVSWNTMISGYAQNGHAKETLQLFEQMMQSGTKPNYVTFIGVITACCHTGLVDKGCLYFNSMIDDHCITPRPDHYACMVDLFGRAGRLNEAEDLINRMPFEPDAIIWGALLGACRTYGNVDLGKRAAENLFQLEPQSAGPYVLLSNIYASAGKWDDVINLRNVMKEKGVKKVPGCSWIEVGNRVHAFLAED